MAVETIFLACFLFGALFTAASVLLGFAGVGGHAVHHAGGPHGGPAANGSSPTGHGPASNRASANLAHGGAPLFTLSSAMAGLTWFGAAGYVLARYAAWTLAGAAAGGIAAGVVAWILVFLFLRKLLEGERELDPSDFRMEGTIGHVTVSIPPNGVGEIVFTQGGTRHSGAARALSGRPIPRDMEVVVTTYSEGVALVQPWQDYIAQSEPASPTSSPSGNGA